MMSSQYGAMKLNDTVEQLESVLMIRHCIPQLINKFRRAGYQNLPSWILGLKQITH